MFVGGYTGVVNDTFDVLAASAITGEFAVTNLPALGAGLAWNVHYSSNSVSLSIASAPPPSGYDAYAQQITNSASRGYQGDPDGDGYMNLLEYVTGGDPTNSDRAARMESAQTNGCLALRFTRNTNAIDATLIVEGSYGVTNDASWVGFATNFNGSWGGTPNVTESGTSTPVTVIAQDTAAPATNRFLRLRVTRP